MDDELITVQTSHATDELPHVITGLAKRTVAYFRLLCEQDLDPDFAELLARDWHTAQLDKWVRASYVDRYQRPMTADERERYERVTREFERSNRSHPSG